jgi:hypothetical protein
VRTKFGLRTAEPVPWAKMTWLSYATTSRHALVRVQLAVAMGCPLRAALHLNDRKKENALHSTCLRGTRVLIIQTTDVESLISDHVVVAFTHDI